MNAIITGNMKKQIIHIIAAIKTKFNIRPYTGCDIL